VTDTSVPLIWWRFTSFITARDSIGPKACIYVQADSDGHPIRVGLARSALHARYRGGTGWALEAAMYSSGNLWFVAGVERSSCEAIEET